MTKTMKITNVKCIVLKGERDHPGEYYGERLIKPTDIYDEFRVRPWSKDDNLPQELGNGKLAVTGRFLVVETDEGATGMFGPIGLEPALLALGMGRLLAGQDALAGTKLWDILYRAAIHGRKGIPMLAISALDCALWDLRGQVMGQPVYRLLGGPTRDKLPIYVSTLACSLEPDKVRKQAIEFRDMGYKKQKWFFRHGPGSGVEGFRLNIRLMEILRETLGPDYGLMFDAWNSWDIPYTLKFAAEAVEFNPEWIEEPVMPDKIDQMAEITSLSPIPIAGGEHEYTRWGMAEVFNRRAVNIAQPDPMWAGGITEMQNIFTLASVHGVPVIPHGESLAASLHLAAAQTPDVCPMLENLYRFNLGWQHFLVDPVTPVDGYIKPDPRPGLGLVIDESKVMERTELTYPTA